MIKCDKGKVEIKGSRLLVQAEACTLLKSMGEIFGKDDLEEITKISKMSIEDLERENEKATKKIAEEFFKLFFGEKDGE